MSGRPKTPVMTFEDAVMLHVLRAAGVTYAELSRTFNEHTGRVTQVLEGEFYGDSWMAAIDRLEAGAVWDSRVTGLVARLGAEALLAAVKAGDPARRRYNRKLKRLRKTTIPFVTQRPAWEAPRYSRTG